MAIVNVELTHECRSQHLSMGTARMTQDEDTEEGRNYLSLLTNSLWLNSEADILVRQNLTAETLLLSL